MRIDSSLTDRSTCRPLLLLSLCEFLSTGVTHCEICMLIQGVYSMLVVLKRRIFPQGEEKKGI